MLFARQLATAARMVRAGEIGRALMRAAAVVTTRVGAIAFDLRVSFDAETVAELILEIPYPANETSGLARTLSVLTER